MTKDIIQLIAWVFFGWFLTWGIFLAYVGFRSTPSDSGKSRLAKSAAIFSLVIGVAWIIFWVSAVVFNAIQIAGAL